MWPGIAFERRDAEEGKAGWGGRAGLVETVLPLETFAGDAVFKAIDAHAVLPHV